jgi:predicted 3-demethylubiquinone-9 3-methyltransferase (glyoxalase superfamily)
MALQKITPFLWFDREAEEAAKFYASIFPDSKITAITRYGDAGPGPKGSVMTVSFQIHGHEFTALNGGPQFKFTEAVSFVVNCKDQAEIDYYWDKLGASGSEVACGWLRDQYGLFWQIVPDVLLKFLQKGGVMADSVMSAMMRMRKLDVAELERAARAKAHHISTAPAGERVRVTWRGEVIADSRDALAMKEGDYPVVHYLPRKDVRMDRLERSSHTTHCPFKGDASYFSLKGGPQNAVWSYEQPYEEAGAIREYLAFYPDKVDSISIG